MISIDWIRHTSLRVTGAICYGQTDVDVSDTFTSEAEEVKKITDTRTYDAVFTSPLQRARKLSTYCGFDGTPEPRVMERNFGRWEMQPWEEVFRQLREEHKLGEEHPNLELMAPPGGETVNRLITRVGDFVEEVRDKYKTGRIAVFCHGGVINSARYLSGELDLQHLFVLVPGYASITTIEYV